MSNAAYSNLGNGRTFSKRRTSAYVASALHLTSRKMVNDCTQANAKRWHGYYMYWVNAHEIATLDGEIRVIKLAIFTVLFHASNNRRQCSTSRFAPFGAEIQLCIRF